MNKSICIVGTLAAIIPLLGLSAMAACFSAYFEAALGGRPLPLLTTAMIGHPFGYLGSAAVLLVYSTITCLRASPTTPQVILHVAIYCLITSILSTAFAIAVALPVLSYIEPFVR